MLGTVRVAIFLVLWFAMACEEGSPISTPDASFNGSAEPSTHDDTGDAGPSVPVDASTSAEVRTAVPCPANEDDAFEIDGEPCNATETCFNVCGNGFELVCLDGSWALQWDCDTVGAWGEDREDQALCTADAGVGCGDAG